MKTIAQSITFVLCLFSQVMFGEESFFQIASSKIYFSDLDADLIEVFVSNNKEWYVNQDNEGSQSVPSYNVDKVLRPLSPNEINKFLQVGNIYVQFDGEEYKLTARMPLKGGGPVAGMVGYWVTKAVGYGTVGAALSAPIIATGGAAGAAAGAVGAAAGSAATGTVGATVVAGAISGGGATTAATTAVVALEAAGGAVAAIEAGATGVGVFLTGIPFLP